jgi:hypothetical protein
VGWLSDTLGQQRFTVMHGAGVFKTLCPGGIAPKGADAALASACHLASFEGVKWAIIITAGAVYAWAGLHYLWASRSVKRDLEQA